MKKLFVIALVAVSLVGLVACGSHPPPRPSFNNIEELVSRWYPDVVRVEVLGRGEQWFDPWPNAPHMARYYPVDRLLVLEVFRGRSTPGEIIELRHSDGPRPRRGEDLVLFFRTFEDNRPALLFYPEGLYRFPNSSENTWTLDPEVRLRSVSRRNHLTLTIGDLREIAERNFGDGPHEVVAHSGRRPLTPMMLLPFAIVVAGVRIRKWVERRKLDM